MTALLGACTQADTTSDPALVGSVLPASAFAQPLVRMPLPVGSEIESLVATDHGFAALLRNQIVRGPKDYTWVHKVALSEDGLHWTEHEILMPNGTYRSLVFGDGQLLIAGHGSPPIRRSTDGINWEEGLTGIPEILKLAYLDDRFFALALYFGVFSSRDGVHFEGGAQTETLQFQAMAYGAGTFIAVGSGPIMVSRDGLNWHAVALDCALSHACITVPAAAGPPGCDLDGSCPQAPIPNTIQGFRENALFGNGHFVVDNYISEDAEHWRAIEDPARVPNVFQDGWFMKLEGDTLSAWQQEEVLRTTSLVDDNPEQLDCQTHRCLVIRNAIDGTAGAVDWSLLLIP